MPIKWTKPKKAAGEKRSPAETAENAEKKPAPKGKGKGKKEAK